MNMAVELLAAAPVRLSLGSFFETWLSFDGETSRKSIGRDEYHLNLTVPIRHRLAATGRLNICQVDLASAGIDPGEILPGRPVEVPGPAGAIIQLHVRTNVFLEQAPLIHNVILRILRDPGLAPAEIPLRRMPGAVTWVNRGRFAITLNDALVPEILATS